LAGGNSVSPATIPAEANRASRLAPAVRAWTMLFHPPTICSTGVSARVIRKDAAMIEPAEIWWLIASHAPRPSAPDCRAMRRNLVQVT
jgi:hypothetical protein